MLVILQYFSAIYIRNEIVFFSSSFKQNFKQVKSKRMCLLQIRLVGKKIEGEKSTQ